jgi:protein TonB
LAVGGDIKQAQLLKSVAPAYPVLAKAQHVSGRVQIEAVVDVSGNVAAVKVLSGPALLHQAALQAVKQWKYSPAILDGQPTITHVVVNVDFRNQ